VARGIKWYWLFLCPSGVDFGADEELWTFRSRRSTCLNLASWLSSIASALQGGGIDLFVVSALQRRGGGVSFGAACARHAREQLRLDIAREGQRRVLSRACGYGGRI
jgi:hypothetical protein